ncbi:tetratricopeptide repeat protein [Myxococcota bacterium]
MVLQPEEMELMQACANEYGNRGEYDKMEGVLDGITVLTPDDPCVYASLGFARQRQGKWAAAEEAYCRALELSGGMDTVSAVNLVGVYIAQGRPDDAIELLEQVMSSGDRSPEVTEGIDRVKALLDAGTSQAAEAETDP